MQLELVGVGLLALLLVLGTLLRAPVTVALFASMPFGATAIAMLPALGGASLMIFTPLSGLLIASALLRKNAINDFRTVFASHWAAMVIVLLALYVVSGSFLLPRLFAGETSVFVPGMGRILEVPLMPVSGNINQTCYFVANSLLFFAAGMLLLRSNYFNALRAGMFAFATIHVVLCVADIGGKVAGAGDVLSFLRTAGYTMLTNVQAEGFWRIVGGYPEASTCGAATAAALAFTFSYWRLTGSRFSLALTISLGLLLIFSTSTTGYVVGLALAVAFLVGVVLNAAQGRIQTRDVWVLTVVLAVGAVVLAAAATDDRALHPLSKLLQTSLFEKAYSASAAERFYWNYKSLVAFADTNGLGIGLGSSRASSWIVAVVSQLGVVGAVALLALSFQIVKPVGQQVPPHLLEIVATCRGLRAAAFAWLVAGLTSGGGADPGALFFIAIAALIAVRNLLPQQMPFNEVIEPLGGWKATSEPRAGTEMNGAKAYS